ncbi:MULTISPECIES: Cro/CI family transcriptional regulator [unclassified Pseudomonas]|uniref:Cro/CI family transcriptional regulator n=1 Tax=unclassified Pseudomonas TaxID=196821 RepID=UPI00128E18C7|nr:MULTISPECIES: Cro/CI family transcriptional regulator [unclassified Pseudomonas]MPQ68309.1 Rha family transcriptional regulator [Pseudomonas sp. MWU12-2323]
MKTPVERLVEHFGDQVKTARELGVSQPAVSQWLSGSCGLSASTAFVAEEKTSGAIKAWELCRHIPKPPADSAELAVQGSV